MIRLVWLLLLAVHTGAVAVWWWLMPGGYPSSSPEFWVNQVAPPLVIGLLLTALLARGRLSEVILPPVLAMIPLFWIAFGVSARIVFPASFSDSWNLPFFAGALFAGLWVKQFRLRVHPIALGVVLVAAAAGAGWTFPGTQRAPDAATAPTGAPLDAASTTKTRADSDDRMIRLDRDAQFHPDEARLVVRHDKLVLNVQPLLSFADRSPDRCWAALAPPGQGGATARTLVSRSHDAAGWTLLYKDEDASVLGLATRHGAIEIDARCRLSHPIFSHTNSFTELSILGQHALSVAFSPAPEHRIAIAAAGAPERFAYVDGRGLFHVAQASQRQRGPFSDLATGPLRRGDPLILTIYDGDKVGFRVTLADFAAQASTQLSPTAGDGIPVNAIELVGGAAPAGSRALIAFSLAATSIGRGTQTVGHAAGVYRNRITITP